MPGRVAAVAAVGLAVALCAPSARAALGPSGFQERTISAAFLHPTAFADTGDGRIFVIEKRGVLKVVRSDGTLAPQTVYDLSQHVNSFGEPGCS